eukprot:GHVT01029749.1.p1 GENE.GHVT01029749.1~~GHVT01029749.1.p1  ORF type:complete len:156 (-),score=24.55 GHVT01029749.1:735-1202(-)
MACCVPMLFLPFPFLVPILSELDAYEVSRVCDALGSRSFEGDATIIEEGTAGDLFFILVEGEATALKAGEVVMQYKAGDFFGELALLKDAQNRAATVKAGPSGCRVACLDKAAFKRLLGPIEGVMKRNRDTYQQHMKALGMDTDYLERMKTNENN